MNFLISSRWVILFALLCYIGYEQSLRTRNDQFLMLSEQLDTLLENKKKALALQNDLKTQVSSQSDPVWVELTLMKGLGLVPEGQTKIFFFD
jgi:hypothetical protein